jgi:hypothetical protein
MTIVVTSFNVLLPLELLVSNRAKRPAQATYCQPCLCCAVQLTQNTTRRPVGLPPSSTLLPTPATTPPVHHHHSSVRLPRNGSRAQGRAGHHHPDDPQPRLLETWRPYHLIIVQDGDPSKTIKLPVLYASCGKCCSYDVKLGS